MTHAEKLAEEYARISDFEYATKWTEIEKIFISGYAAAQKDADGLVRALELISQVKGSHWEESHYEIAREALSEYRKLTK